MKYNNLSSLTALSVNLRKACFALFAGIAVVLQLSAQAPTFCPAITAPLNGTGIPANQTTVDFKWDLTGATTYSGMTFYLTTNADGSGPYLDTRNFFPGETAYNNYVISSLVCGQTYYWKIVPFNGAPGTGSYNTSCPVFSFKKVGPGNPSVFPTGTWNGYVYDDVNFTNYKGYLTQNDATGLGLNFNSTTTNPGSWGVNGNPTASATFTGCTFASADNFSISYKRQATLAAGTYSITLNYSNTPAGDQAILLVNGTPVITRPSAAAAWLGNLPANPQLEVRFKESTGTASVSLAIVPAVAPAFSAGTLTADQSICYNTDPSSNFSATAATGCTLSYQWQSSTSSATGPWTNIAAATLVSYNPPALKTTTYYQRVVTDACGRSGATPALKITVGPNYAAGAITASKKICTGSPVTFASVTPASGGLAGTTPVYQWQFKSAATSNVYVTISGATNASYTSGPITQTTTYRRGVTFTGTCASATVFYSNLSVITVQSGIPVIGAITGVPSIATGYCPGNTGVSFTVSATNADSYAWSVPAGVTITAGVNTKTIWVDFEEDYTGGTLSVTATNVCGTTSASTATLTASTNCNAVWNGSVSNVWATAANWTPATVPGNITTVTIPAGTANSPLLNNSNRGVGNITIDAGATVTLTGSSVFSIYGNLVSNGTITQSPSTTVFFTSAGNQSAEGDLNTLTNVRVATVGTLTLGSDWTLAGAIRFSKGTFDINGKNFVWDLDNGARVDFVNGDVGTVSGTVTLTKTMPQFTHYISSPLAGVTGAQIADDVLVVQGNTSRLYTWDFAAQLWVKQLSPAAVSLEPSLGARMYFPTAGGDELDFTGTYNHTASYTTAAQSNAAAGKYLIAGNPYPSVLDWEAPVGWTFNNVSPTIYYWNQSQSKIATYTRGTGTSTNGGSRYIPIMQSFFVTTTGSGGTASLGISNRVRTTQSAPLYRTANADNVLSITVAGTGTDNSDETVLYLADDATSGYDNDLDAYKMKNGSAVPNLYTKLDETEYAVNAIPATTDITIPLHLTVPADGSYILTVPSNASADIILVDKKEHVEKVVDGSAYRFTASSADAADRFELQLRSSSSGAAASTAESVTFASNGSNVVLISKNDLGRSTVKIYNSVGVEITELSGVNVVAGANILNSIQLQSGAYIVKVQNNGNEYTGHVALVK